jgi:aminopeptidase N
MGDFLLLALKVRPGTHPLVVSDVATHLRTLDREYAGLPGRTVFRKFALHVLRPLFASTGWTSKPGESSSVTLLRRDLLMALSQLDAPEIVAAARKRFAAYLADPASLSPDLTSNVLAVVGAHADLATWEQLHTLARNAKSSLEQRRFYLLLGTARDGALAQRALALALTDEIPVTLKPDIIDSVAGDFREGDGDHAEMAFDFALAHIEEIAALLEPSSRTEYIPGLAAETSDLSAIAKLRVYADANIPASARQSVVKAEAAITYAAMIRSKRLPEVDRWLKRARR